MSATVLDDRLAHLLMFSGEGSDYAQAVRRLDQATLVLKADACVQSSWGQAALLTAAECAVRMFSGGVYLGQSFDETRTVGSFLRMPLKRYLFAAGCRSELRHLKPCQLDTRGVPGPDYMGLRCWPEAGKRSSAPSRPIRPRAVTK